MRKACGRGPVTAKRRVRATAWAVLAAALLAVVLPATAALARDGVLPVPRGTIYPGTMITDAMLIDRKFRASEYDGASVAASRPMIVGKVARSTLLPNQPVSIGGIREPFAVQQGQPAVVFFRSGGLVISGTAVPLQAGSIGDVIGLRNTDSGTTIRGKVQADGTVQVGLP